jgi:hypothetical protein
LLTTLGLDTNLLLDGVEIEGKRLLFGLVEFFEEEWGIDFATEKELII